MAKSKKTKTSRTRKKKLPSFASEDQEARYWAKTDSAQHMDLEDASEEVPVEVEVDQGGNLRGIYPKVVRLRYDQPVATRHLLGGVLPVLAGCHVVLPLDPPSPPDAISPVDGTSDSGSSDRSWPDLDSHDSMEPDGPPSFSFSKPRLLLDVSDHDDGPHLSQDGLRLYFSSRLGGNRDLWVATRPDTTSDFNAPVRLGELSTSAIESDPTLSADELVIIYERDSGTGEDLYQATRPSLGQPFDKPHPLALNTAMDDEDPALSADGLTLVLVSDRHAKKNINDLWVAVRPKRTSPFASPIRLAAISSGDDDEPTVTAAVDLMIFASLRPGGPGSSDLWVTWRVGTVTEWAPPKLLAISTAQEEVDPFIHPGLRLLLFCRDGNFYSASY